LEPGALFTGKTIEYALRVNSLPVDSSVLDEAVEYGWRAAVAPVVGNVAVADARSSLTSRYAALERS
jgi:hypothetical protein